MGLGQGVGLGGLGLDHQRALSSRENFLSMERLDNHHAGSIHASREDLSANGGAGMEGYLSGSRSQLNALTRRQASSREHLAGPLMSSRSREQLDTNGGGAQAQPCREWLRSLPPRQPSLPDQPLSSSSPPPPISEEPQQEPLPSSVQARGRLDSAPPCRYPGPTVPQAPGLNPLTRQPSSEHLDILSSILASFNSSVLTPPAVSSPGPNGSARGPPSSSPPQSATSHSISEVSPDSE